MDQLKFESATLYSFPKSPDLNTAKRIARATRRMPPLIAFHLAVTLGLSLLGTFLQFEFYREHDVLPGYACPLAIAGTFGMLSLASMKFPGVWTDAVRKLLYGACYIFMVLSSSFHVANKAWNDATKTVKIEYAQSDVSPAASRALEAMTDALKLATKNRAWNVMETMGVQVSKQIVPQAIVHKPNPFGISEDWVAGAGAIIIISLRALLEGIQALTAIAVRNHFSARHGR